MEPMTNEERKIFKTFINMRKEIAMNGFEIDEVYLQGWDSIKLGVFPGAFDMEVGL